MFTRKSPFPLQTHRNERNSLCSSSQSQPQSMSLVVMLQRPTTSVSYDLHLLSAALEDEDTEEAVRDLRGTESSCASPVLRKSSTRSSFLSAAGYRDWVQEETTGRWKRRRYGQKGEEELRNIQQNALETKSYLLEVTRRLRNRADTVKTASVSASLEGKALREYVQQLGGRLDRLVAETEETERQVKRLGRDLQRREEKACKVEGKEGTVRCSCFL